MPSFSVLPGSEGFLFSGSALVSKQKLAPQQNCERLRSKRLAQELLLVRHAKTAAEYSGRYVGITDASLAPEGLLQAAELISGIARRQPQRCVCSPLARTRQTARAICQCIGLAAEIDPELREVNFGRWEGLTFEEVVARDPELVSRWALFDDRFAFPGGESLAEFHNRIRSLANRLAADPAERIIVVTHGGVIRALICHFLGLPLRSCLSFEVECASLTTIKLFKDSGVLIGLNEFRTLPSHSK